MDPQSATTLALTAGIALMMVMSGLGKNMLELRRRSRNCPSCGQKISGRVCKRH